MINKILRTNCPINCDDLKSANDIFGASVKALKVKTVQKPGYHAQLEIKNIPSGFLARYKNVTLATDIMFVNNIRF